MNRCETLFRSSRMAGRVVRSVILRSREIKRGEKPTSSLYALIYSPVADRLGIQKGSTEERNAKKVVFAISQSWFRADAMLDQEALYSEADQEEIAQEKEQALNGRLVIDESVPADIKEEVEGMEKEARKKAYKAHMDFMEGFDPATSTFEDVIGYRTRTSGLMGETLVRAIAIVAGENGGNTPFRDDVINEALCLQMCDDLVDSVSDYRKGLPNLLYALTLENPLERRRFESASMNQAIIDTRRPYDIAQLYAPGTLLSYMQRFQAMSSLLPADRRRFAKDSMATMTRLSYSPNATLEKITRTEIGQMLARKTKIE